MCIKYVTDTKIVSSFCVGCQMNGNMGALNVEQAHHVPIQKLNKPLT